MFDNVVIPNKAHFDVSDMQRKHLQDNSNKKVLGNFKDELNGKLLTDFLALNPQVYSYTYLGFIDDKFDKN